MLVYQAGYPSIYPKYILVHITNMKWINPVDLPVEFTGMSCTIRGETNGEFHDDLQSFMFQISMYTMNMFQISIDSICHESNW